ncbi:hypothetical protein L210DRAFT_2740006 [Boletus edulis BED1]|uniref:Uncharacterized protein n=1 Tax=Boletus edulis BED1 TaxID=1328754 RepID=A0AAD4BAF1_BOLED|nr:hypothetical protein L210DRAFT_2740006 [Boletus edulis BED1]
MERSREIFCEIASASRQVVAIANNYAKRKDYKSVSRCHFQLEEDMRRISVACQCLVGILDKLPPEEGPIVDDRIRDWVGTHEPQECLDTLRLMEELLQQDTFTRIRQLLRRGRGSTATQDKIKEAVDHFNSCKGCFHFLFSTEIWNNERAVQKQQDVPQPQPRCHIVHGENLEPRFLAPARTDINSANSLDPAVHRGGDTEHAAQGGSNIVVQAEPSAIVQETVAYQDRHGATQRRHELKSGKHGEEEKLEEILKWLDGLNCAEKHDVTLSLRQADTCKWLFDTTKYRTWRDGANGFLWLRGKRETPEFY